MTGKPNPFCACGCGYEVALPWNKFIQGHARATQLTDVQRAEAKRMLAAGVPTYQIAAKFGCSQPTVLNWKKRGLLAPKPAARVIRKEELALMVRVKQKKEKSG